MFEATEKSKNIKRSVWLMLFCLMISANLSAQTVSESNDVPQISVSKLKWKKRLKSSPFAVFSSDSLSNDPNDRGLSGSNSRNTSPSPIPPGGLPTYYLYQAVFTNTGEKKIRGIECDYVLIDPASGEEVGRHRLSNYAKLNKNQSATLYGRDSRPPSRIISAEALGKDKSSQYIERIEFRCVQYADNSMWRAANIEDGECNGLRWAVRRQFRSSPWH